MFNAAFAKKLLAKFGILVLVATVAILVVTLVAVNGIFKHNNKLKSECSLIVEDYKYAPAELKTINGLKVLQNTIHKGTYLCDGDSIQMEQTISTGE